MCSHWFSSSGFAPVSPRTVPPVTTAARKPERLATAYSLVWVLCPKSKTWPEAPVGRNSQPVTVSVSSPKTVCPGS